MSAQQPAQNDPQIPDSDDSGKDQPLRTRYYYLIMTIMVVIGVVIDIAIFIGIITNAEGRVRVRLPGLHPSRCRCSGGRQVRRRGPGQEVSPPGARLRGPVLPGRAGPAAGPVRTAPVRTAGRPADGTAERRLRPGAWPAGSSERSAAGPARPASAAGPGAAVGPVRSGFSEPAAPRSGRTARAGAARSATESRRAPMSRSE